MALQMVKIASVGLLPAVLVGATTPLAIRAGRWLQTKVQPSEGGLQRLLFIRNHLCFQQTVAESEIRTTPMSDKKHSVNNYIRINILSRDTKSMT
jgi:hypothetical protein